MPAVSRKEIDHEREVDAQLKTDLCNLAWYGSDNPEVVKRAEAKEREWSEKHYRSFMDDQLESLRCTLHKEMMEDLLDDDLEACQDRRATSRDISDDPYDALDFHEPSPYVEQEPDYESAAEEFADYDEYD